MRILLQRMGAHSTAALSRTDSSEIQDGVSQSAGSVICILTTVARCQAIFLVSFWPSRISRFRKIFNAWALATGPIKSGVVVLLHADFSFGGSSAGTVICILTTVARCQAIFLLPFWPSRNSRCGWTPTRGFVQLFIGMGVKMACSPWPRRRCSRDLLCARSH
jgi:hypothetical protein